MSVYLAVACLLALVALHRFGGSGVCVQCQGRGSHRDDCPLRRDP